MMSLGRERFVWCVFEFSVQFMHAVLSCVYCKCGKTHRSHIHVSVFVAMWECVTCCMISAPSLHLPLPQCVCSFKAD